MDIRELAPWRRGRFLADNAAKNPGSQSLQGQMDRWFDDMWGRFDLPAFTVGPLSMADFSPRLDVVETEDAYRFTVELPGVGGMSFLRAAVNARRVEAGEEEIDQLAFVKIVREKAKLLGINDEMLKRAVNVGFSGGEKKRYEILQMALLEPTMAVLDETDSGLDVDALGIVSDGVNLLREPGRAMLVITHYQRLLNHIVPDYVHILAGGKIRKSGGKELALEVEESGYAGIDDAA